ncbi:uncharacterized protein knl1 isoform X3 [Hippocampus zosterae]|uniref:uncharacterized protein knl1 isoform X3 n=1 Tax=Hippocampus zosterae TaxID=109293 RepID=UPI00223E6D23|nr:uncharacterized protein knl1 isoform X3 [Hippocampus zosterae]
MELLDSGKNDENSGYFSRRRISSILKDPWKSTRFSDPEQQENEVECAKPVGKRNSRRVSFAPANDVLLYSKDAKHASPVRGPFQELMSTAIPAQNGVQGSVGEEGIVQQIMGMEPLITAPLHAYDVKGNANFELGEGFGEKTVMYNEDDDFMEMTQSHTINIVDTDDYHVDGAQKNRPTLLSCGKKSTMSSANGKSMDMSLSHNTSIARELEMPCAGQITDFSVMSSVLSSDPSFNNLLRSKSHGSNVRQHETIFETKMSLIKTQKVDVDKENQAPILVHSETGKSPHNGKNIGLSHDDDGKMNVTVTHTNHVAGLNDDPDDPFQCLFPQQEMYSQCDTASQARHTRITMGSSNPKAFGNRLEKENAGEATLQIADKNSLKYHSFHALQEQRDNSKEKSTEKATGFIADDTCLDMAQSCTAKITGALPPPPAPNFNHFLCEGKTALLAPSMEKKHRATIGHPLSSRISLDPKFEKFLANIFKTDGPRVNPGHARMTRVNPLVRANEQPFNGDPMHSKEDLSMNMTEFQRDIVTRIDKPLQCLLPTQLIHPKGQQATFHQLFSDEQRSSYNTGKGIGTSDNSNLDVTQSGSVNTPRIFTMQSRKILDSLPSSDERTVRFTANDAAMDMTQSLTVNIDLPFEPSAHKSVPFINAGGENTIRFSANDAAMDMTQSLTAMIDTPFEGGAPKSVPFVHAGGENTIRFSENDAAMDMTQNLTTVIDTQSEAGAHKEVHSVPIGGEKTIRFSANDAAMDMTQSLTAMIDTPFEAGANKSVPFVHAGGENTMRFSANDAAMDMTQSLTAMIDTPLDPEAHKNHSVATGGEKNISFSASDAAMDVTQRKRSLSVLSFNPGQNTFCNTGFPWPHRVVTKVDPPAEPSFGKAVDTNCFMPAQLKTLYVDDKCKVPGVTTLHDSLLSTQKNADGTLPGVDVSINPTDVQTDSSTQRPYADVGGTQAMTSQQTFRKLGRDVEESPDAVNSEETQSRKEAESMNETSSLSQKLNSPGAGDDGRDSSQSARFRIADLQLKVRRLSQMVSATSETNLEAGTDKNTKEEHKESEFVPDVQPGLRDTEDEDTRYGLQGYTAVGTPFKLKTPELMSRLSTRGFKPKLPQRSRADEPKKAADSASGISQEKSAGRTATDVTSTLNKWNDDDVSDIHDEELGSCEDFSDTLDNKISENAIPFEDFNVDETSPDNVFQENSPNGAQGIKRRLPSDENQTGAEKKMKASSVMLPEAVATEIPAHVPEYDRVNTTTVPSSNQTMDSSNSSRSDATFNSTFKHSMLESHLEDRDVQKLNDGSITAREFFKLFNIDFVIHKPRQSVLPSRVGRGTGCSAIDVLKNRHINHPKLIVYEADFEIVSQKMEGLNCRILDLNKPLKVINQDLWADVKKSSEKEIRSLGVKLKERNNFFRKMSKVRAHEMKSVLYSSLVQTLADEQQKFKSAVESNEMIQILDDCIGDLEAELAAVEEKGTENMPSLKSLQEEIKKVNEALDDKNRQLHELEVQKKQAPGKLRSLKAETRNLESFIGTLHTLTEWRFREKTENYTVYTFLNDTLHLQLVHAGNGTEKEPECKTAQVNFQFLLHDENSENHACLVHKLLSQHIKGETAWVERYPTSSYIPKLLHDVSSVVSTCRLLGEELRMLKMWGGLRLNIVDICCEDTRVNLVFSSLRKRCKFEVTLSVTLANHLYVLQVHGFNNVIGDTTAKQIERIVESFTPAKKLLTKIVKKIHCDVLV